MIEEESKEIQTEEPVLDANESIEAPQEVVEPKKEKKAKKPKSKARKIIEWVLTGFFLAIFAVVMVGQIQGMVDRKNHYGQQIRLGFATFVVQTTSMEPEIKKGSAIVTFLEDVESIYKRYQKHEKIDLTFVTNGVPDNDFTKPANEQYKDRVYLDGVPITHRLQEMKPNNSAESGVTGKYIMVLAGIYEGEQAAKDSQGRICQYQVITEKQLIGVVITNSPFLGGAFNFIGSPFGLLALLLIPAFYLVITSVLDIFKAYKDPEEEGVSSKSASTDSGNEKGTAELSEEDKKRLNEELLKEMMEKRKGGGK